MKRDNAGVTWLLKDAPGEDAAEVRGMLCHWQPGEEEQMTVDQPDVLVERALVILDEKHEAYRDSLAWLGLDLMGEDKKAYLKALDAAYHFGFARGRVAGLEMAKEAK